VCRHGPYASGWWVARRPRWLGRDPEHTQGQAPAGRPAVPRVPPPDAPVGPPSRCGLTGRLESALSHPGQSPS
jgi:hypothetical protein